MAKPGPRPIIDEFSSLPVSRQRKWQLRRRKEGRCGTCGDVAITKDRCEAHCLALALIQLKHRAAPTIPRRGKWLKLASERGGETMSVKKAGKAKPKAGKKAR